MGRTFDCIIQIYKTIKEREPKYYRESVSAYERAFLELLDTKEVTGGSNADTIEALHALFLKHLEPCDFTKAEEIYFRFGHSEDGVAEAFLKLLFSELSLKKEISFVLIESGVAETLPDCAFRRRAAQKLALLQNHKFAEQYYEIAEKYDGLSVVTGISKRDLYIPLRGRYMGRVNETSFYLEDEIDEFVQERGTANVMLLFGEAGQGKSTFVRSYFCKAFFEDKMVLLFKLADVLPSMFFGFRLRVRDFLETYGLNGEMLGGGLLILDGLDEVVGELTAKSYNLSEFINELEEELSDIAKNCKLLITSRPQGIEDRLIGYEKIKISGLSFSDQKKWILKYAGLSGNREFSEQTLLSIRSTFAELSKLMETPLLFEMIVAHGVNDNIKNRVFLFERLFKDIVNAGRPKDIHRLFERLAVEEFVEGKGSKVKEAEIKYAYHQSFVEFYHISEGVAGAEFVHRSFYQHFLGYGLVNAFLQSLSSREALVGFLKKLGKRRLEKYELDNIGWIAQREHLYLTEGPSAAARLLGREEADALPVTEGVVFIPDDVVEICAGAFEGRKDLRRVIMGKNVKQIGERAFANCFSLKKIFLGERLAQIGLQAFSRCYALDEVESFSTRFEWRSGRFLIEGGKALIGAFPKYGETECELPISLRYIEPYVFEGLTGLERIVISEGTVYIARHAVHECEDLKEVIIPFSVRFIADNAVSACPKIKFCGHADSYEEL